MFTTIFLKICLKIGVHSTQFLKLYLDIYMFTYYDYLQKIGPLTYYVNKAC